MSKLDRLIFLAEQNNQLLRELSNQSELTTSYGRDAFVKESIGVRNGLPTRELAVLDFREDSDDAS